MIIIKDYRLEEKKPGLFYVRGREKVKCPHCAGGLKVVGSRKRTLYMQDASKIYLMIRRMKCSQCGRLHHELPDIAVPYKRYESSVIEAVLVSDSQDTPYYPCEQSTAVRVQNWFLKYSKKIENTLYKREKLYGELYKIQLPLYPLSRQPSGWLSVLIRDTACQL